MRTSTREGTTPVSGGALRPSATASPIVASISRTSAAPSRMSARASPAAAAPTDRRRWTAPNTPRASNASSFASTSAP